MKSMKLNLISSAFKLPRHFVIRVCDQEHSDLPQIYFYCIGFNFSMQIPSKTSKNLPICVSKTLIQTPISIDFA